MEASIPMQRREAKQFITALWTAPTTQSTEHIHRDPSEGGEVALRWYLDYCRDEIDFTLRRNNHLLDNMTLSGVIRTLKKHPSATKTQLAEKIYEPPESGPSLEDRMTALDLAVRLAFATACSTATQDTIERDLFRPRWYENECLEKYIARVYPPELSEALPQDNRSIRVEKLAAGYLASYAKLEIMWTHRLTDHLTLLRKSNRKTLYVFCHPGFLKASIEILEAHRPNQIQKTTDALSLGCLPPRLIRETLATFNLLFPKPGDELSRTILNNEVSKRGLDTFLLRPFPYQDGPHERPQDAVDPEDVRGLFQKYPYWAERLYTLWREADDPTPVTEIGRWSESRRNPRFTYWCAFLSLTLALMFGVAATILGALQVWISFCSWNDNQDGLCMAGKKPTDRS